MISDKSLEINDYWGKLRYSSLTGCFFEYINSTYSNFEKECCRELITEHFGKTQYLGWVKENLDVEKLNEFFETIEGKLGLEIKSIIYRTNIKDAVIVEYSPFWIKNTTNKSLFTLFLRCGGIYYNGNLNWSLYSYRLTNSVKPAIDRFLDGFTIPTYGELTPCYSSGNRRYEGFVTQFANRHKEEIEKMLVKEISEKDLTNTTP